MVFIQPEAQKFLELNRDASQLDTRTPEENRSTQLKTASAWGKKTPMVSVYETSVRGVTVRVYVPQEPALADAPSDLAGRIITAAALIMSISFAALIAANVSFMRMFGLGLTLAVLVDATLVRMVLVPAFMHLMGNVNWWAPAFLKRVHERLGFSEEPAAKPDSTEAEQVST